MVGTDLGHKEAVFIAPSSVSDESQGCHHEIFEVQVRHPPTSREDGGSDQLCLCSRAFEENLSEMSQLLSKGGSEEPSAIHPSHQSSKEGLYSG